MTLPDSNGVDGLFDSPITVAPEPVVPDHTATRQRPPWMRSAASGKDNGRARKPRERKHVPQSKPGEFVQPIADGYRLLAAIMLPFSPVGGVILETDDRQELTEHTPNPNYGKDRAQLCAEALDEAAQKSDGLRRVLQMLTTGGVWGKVAVAHAPIALAVVQYHTPWFGQLQAWQMKRMQEAMERQEQANASAA